MVELHKVERAKGRISLFKDYIMLGKVRLRKFVGRAMRPFKL